MTKCPCDDCKFKSMNFTPNNKCPNFKFFFDAYMSAYEGVLKTDKCEKWEAKE